MHVISQMDIPESTRAKFLAKYRSQLRAALSNPALTGKQRQDIKRKLAGVGGQKEYRADSPPPPGAIDPMTGLQPQPVQLPEPALRRLRKDDVFAIGQSEGVFLSLSQTKDQMIEAILLHR